MDPREDPRGPPGLCTRAIQMCRLALTVGELSLTSMLQEEELGLP